MALDPIKQNSGGVVTCSLLLLLYLHAVTGWPIWMYLDNQGFFFFPSLCGFFFPPLVDAGMSGWGGCLEGRDVFVSIPENSPDGAAVADVMTETMLDEVHWSLGGKDAGWLSLEEGNIRLNLSDDRVLDREVAEHGSILHELAYRLKLNVSLAQDTPTSVPGPDPTSRAVILPSACWLPSWQL